MEQESNMNKTVAVILCVLVVAGLVFITINKKDEAPVVPADGLAATVETNAMNEEQTESVNEEKGEVKEVPGVKITVLSAGTGAVAKAGDTVAMNYTGTLSDGTTFDSNVDPKFNHVQPFVFTIGAGQVIKGWDVGIDGMKIGEKRKLVLSPDFAYGSTGAGGVIPPNATLTFEVELLAIK